MRQAKAHPAETRRGARPLRVPAAAANLLQDVFGHRGRIGVDRDRVLHALRVAARQHDRHRNAAAPAPSDAPAGRAPSGPSKVSESPPSWSSKYGSAPGHVDQQFRLEHSQRGAIAVAQPLQVLRIADAVRQVDVQARERLLAGIVIELVDGEGEDGRVVREDGRRAVAVVHVAIHHHGAPDHAVALQPPDGDGDIVDGAEALAVARKGVMESAADVEPDADSPAPAAPPGWCRRRPARTPPPCAGNRESRAAGCPGSVSVPVRSLRHPFRRRAPAARRRRWPARARRNPPARRSACAAAVVQPRYFLEGKTWSPRFRSYRSW